MWARVIEFMLGCWLAISPFIFRHDPQQTFLWVNDLACAALVMAVALVCYWPRVEWLHPLQILVGLWLVGSVFLHGSNPPPPADQNHIVVGLLLMMFGVIPSRVNLPPRRWREFHGQRE